ncbi:21753_t:CDS:2 [Racocetra persica]|uniref:21753_t:CDS:1 n=1 Tax=Racocetra persica TaxID=160502 RepID=A0ACA9NUQ9_9GLOM|nr:21753_t:CDS:2 [Racocetra persica]
MEDTFETLSSLIKNIFTIHESIQLNEKISKSTIDRIVSTEAVLKFLKIRKIEYKKKFQDLQYQELFYKFQKLLTEIKVLAEKVLQSGGIKTILNANNIKKKFTRLMKKYDACMRDLKFTMIVDSNILRDDFVVEVKSIKEILVENKQQIEIVYQEVCYIKKQLVEITNFIQAQQFDFQQKSQVLL